MQDESSLALLVGIWIFVIGLVVAARWRKKAVGVGLSFAFLLNLWLIHWPAAVAYLLPWYLYYDDITSLSMVERGFRESTYAVIAFAVGGLILAPFLTRVIQFSRRKVIPSQPEIRLAKIYLAIGLVCFLAVLSPLSRISTVNALIAAGWNFLVIAFDLLCWHAWQERRHRAFAGWFILSLIFPLVTIVLLGFLSFGIMLFFSVAAFIASFVRPRWKLVVLYLLLTYVGLSFYGSYMRDRLLLRELVWQEQASMGDRIKELSLTVSSVEWFNPFNPVHLYWIDQRLNMNLQVASAIDYLEAGNREYARGETLWWSIVALIPRSVWPEKPVVAGGSEFVSNYTGVEYGEETTVAVGLVTEFYINFGTMGVVLGFLCLGVIIFAIDTAAGQCLSKNDWRGFAIRLLPGVALVRAETSLAELTTSAGAAVVIAVLVNSFLARRYSARVSTSSAQAAASH